jgi:hypothetical protein
VLRAARLARGDAETQALLAKTRELAVKDPAQFRGPGHQYRGHMSRLDKRIGVFAS